MGLAQPGKYSFSITFFCSLATSREDDRDIEKEYLYLMKKNFAFLVLLLVSLGLASCVSSTKTLTLSGELQNQSFKNDASLDGSHLFDLSFQNFSLEKGGIRICPAYLQNGSSEAPSDFAQIETAVKPLVSVKAAQGFFDAGFAVDFSGSKITCSFPESYQFQGSDVSIVVYANAKSISIAGGSAVTLDLSRSSEVAINVTGAASLSTEKALALSSLNLTSDGAANFEATGSVTNATYTINGTASIKAKELLSETVKVAIDGSGSAVVHATKSLDVTIDGTGSVTFYGDPVLHQTISGLGTVDKGS